MRRLIVLIVVLLTAPLISAQSGTTTVTAKVVDANGSVYVNCQWSVIFVGENTTPGAGPYAPAPLLNGQQGTCDSQGNFSLNLADNVLTVTPTPSQWSFSICSTSGYLAGPYCKANIPITVTGSTQNISSILTPLMPLLPTGGGGGPVTFPGVPTGTCSPTQTAVNTSTGDYYSCSGGTWLKVGPISSAGNPGGSAFQLQTNSSGVSFAGIANAAKGSALVSQGASAFPVFQIKPVYDVRDYGLVGDGSTDNTAAMKILLAGIGSAPATILFTANSSTAGRYAMNTIAFPANITLDFSAGGSITLITNTTSPGNANFISGTGAECGSASSCSAPSLSVTSGNTVVAMVAPYPGFTYTISSVTDTCGNFYSQVQQSLTNQPRNVGAWISSNSVAGSCTITATATGTLTNSQIIVHQYSGMGPSVSIDGKGASSNTPANPMNSGSATTTSGSLLIGYGGQPFTAETCTAGSGYTQPAGLAGQTATGYMCAEYILSTSGGSQSATQNITTTPSNLVYNMLPLKVGVTTLHVLGGIFDPDLHQICFNCTGTNGILDFTGNLTLQAVYPEWWGASPSASSATNTPALQAAIHGAFGTNRTNASGFSIYNKPLILSGNYQINAELQFYDVLNFKVRCDRRLSGGITQTTANLRIIDGQSIAYGSFDDCIWTGTAASTNTLIDIDYNGTTTTGDLAPQFIDFNRNYFNGNSEVAIGVLIAKSGANAQGSNINCLNCETLGFTQAGWQIGTPAVLATNALADSYSGDMQSNPLYGIAVYGGGYISVSGAGNSITTMENGYSTQTGYDVAGSQMQGPCILEHMRSESRKLISCPTIVLRDVRTIDQSAYATPGQSFPVGSVFTGDRVTGDGANYVVTVDGGAFSGAGTPSTPLNASSGSGTTLVDTNATIAGAVTNGVFVLAETVTQASTGSTGTIAVVPLSVDIITGSVTSGTFSAFETLTQTSTGATAKLDGIPTGSSNLFVTAVTGSPDGTHTWVGGTSGAIYTPTSLPSYGAASPLLVISSPTGSPDGTHIWTGGTSGAVYTPSGAPVAQVAWTTNAFAGMFVGILSGTNINCKGTVVSNTATSLTIGAWTTIYPNTLCSAPDSTSTFVVAPAWSHSGTVTSGGMQLQYMNENVIAGDVINGGGAQGAIEDVIATGGQIFLNGASAPPYVRNLVTTRTDWYNATGGNDPQSGYVTRDWDIRVQPPGATGGLAANWAFPAITGIPFTGAHHKDLGAEVYCWSTGTIGSSGPPSNVSANDVCLGGRSDQGASTDVFRARLELYSMLGAPAPFGTNQNGLPTRIGGGSPTGSGTPGDIEFWLSAAGSSGTTPQTGTEVASIGLTGLSVNNLINTNTGFQINGTAPSGHCLVGNGTEYIDSSGCGGGGGGGISGSGTVTHLPVWNGSTSLGNSSLIDNGTTVTTAEQLVGTGGLAITGTVSGTGFSNYLAAPPAIGGTTPAAGSFSSITDTGMTGGPFCVQETAGVFTSTGSACGSGGSGVAIEVNGGAALTSPVTFNTGTGGNIVDGITIVATNPSASIVQFAISGALTNAGLANSATTVNSQSCTLGSTCTIPEQVNTTNLTSQAGFNLKTSTVNAIGLIVTPTNTATNQVTFEVTGGPVNALGGGTGISSPAAHSVPIAEGSAAFNFISPGTVGYCNMSNGPTADPSYQPCPSGFGDPMTTLGDLITYNGSSAVRLGGPTSPNGVPWTLTSTPAGGVAGLPTWSQSGILGRAVTGTTATDTILDTDCTSRVEYLGSVAVAVTLPAQGTLGVPFCVFKITNDLSTLNDVTVTPTTNTVLGTTSVAIHNGQNAWFYVDPNLSTNWAVDIDESALLAGTGITFTRSPGVGGGLTIAATGGGSGSVTSIATTSPITGGTITTTGTIACATCVVASSPGVGIAHFAGSTQTVTSSPVNLSSDVSNQLPVTAVGSVGLSGTSPVSVASTGVISLVAGALANGMTATTQTAGDTSTDLATDSFVASSFTAIPNGTAAAPSIAFLNNTTNGFYSHAAANICLATSSTDNVCLFNQGVSIGYLSSYGFTTSSSATGTAGVKLAVVGNIGQTLGPSAIALEPQCKVTSGISMSGTAATICSWTLPNSAQTWAWMCSGTYTTTTLADTLSLGMNASQTPTSETGNAQIYSTLAGTQTAGSATATASGNQNILTGASVSTVTAIPWQTSGVLQASATSGTFAITGTLTGTSPAGTVNVGSVCRLY